DRVGDLFDRAAPFAVEAFGAHLHARSELDARDVEFVDLRLDPGLPEVRDGDDRVAGGDGLSGVDVAGDDDAVDRRGDDGLLDERGEARDFRGRGGAARACGVEVAVRFLPRLLRADRNLREHRLHQGIQPQGHHPI
ncbi:MAG TPA: hypothetical protein VGQ36_26830, partial [Thermoanaerobaculia bacterium]|nr:hypothetical protein [Thermoanaerobaculia bacterium]